MIRDKLETRNEIQIDTCYLSIEFSNYIVFILLLLNIILSVNLCPLRNIVAWKLSDTLESPFVLDTVKEALRRQIIKEPLIIHSDRGVHYTSNQYRDVTEHLIRSYSRKANPWDNCLY